MLWTAMAYGWQDYANELEYGSWSDFYQNWHVHTTLAGTAMLIGTSHSQNTR